MEKFFVEVTAHVINKQIENVTSRLTGDLLKLWKKNVPSFKEYVRAASNRYKFTKTLLYKDRPVLLSEIYVGTKLVAGKESIDEDEFLTYLLDGNRCLVTATAGSGKSFFSKWAFLQTLSSKQLIPIFLELRNLNDSSLGIIESIAHELRVGYKISIVPEKLVELIREGKFALILDGYDELTVQKTKEVNLELRDMEPVLDRCPILITSRPGGEEIHYLPGFSVYNVQPLDLGKATSLVAKLDYDDVVKASFLESLNSHLFNQHKDFLSNPLLLTIMLMTYGDLAEIPSKMHIFYEQAFDTLYYRHDSSKGMYRRESKSGLAVDDFRDILACVSASSYLRGKITLTNTDLIGFIRKAKKTARINKLNPANYVDDLVQSVCVLVLDGTRYTYNHRSFQEYFAALFLVQVPTTRKIDVYRRFLEKDSTDSALKLAFEMNQAMVEQDFIKPMLKELLSSCDSALELMRAEFGVVRLRRRPAAIGLTSRTKKPLGPPRYYCEQLTDLWSFQGYVERMYSKASEGFIKFGILTKKAFDEELGVGEVNQQIALDDPIESEQYGLLDRLGIIGIFDKRLQFLRWLDNEIDSRNTRTGSSNLESWL